MMSNNRALCYDEVGQGEEIVFVHGYISDRRIWSQVREHWYDSGHLFFPTLEGFWEDSLEFRESNFSVDNHIEDIVDFLEKVCTPPVHLVGWSYGASLVLLVAARRPDLVKSVFAYEPGISSFVLDKKILQQIQRDRVEMASPAIGAVKAGNTKEAVKYIVNGACNREGVFEDFDEELKQRFFDNASTVPLMFTERSAPNLPASSEDLKRILCPVTISYGEYARPAYRLVAKEAAKIIPNSIIQIIPGAMHVVPVTSPEIFLLKILEHLSGVDRRAVSNGK
ncbi:alpha/beta hydrolase [Sporolactobacillus putidus]|uniref:Alpha/beta hydrolase n=2 Tax=Sporolactobacillus putidus TaxID=492735 RepID=A0A917S793_9BACL|nr:alpha/beta hydrolase [Sporolactobacillus putidus]